MARTKISEFSATPANNTDIDSINIAEGCAPSGINDAIRELMAQLKDFQTGAVGDSFNGPVGTTTAAAGAFTTLSASSTVSGTGFSTYLASPPAIGGTAAAAGSFTTLSASGNVTLSGGTANGVAYLNGSKVVTSGSALTFDGTRLTTTSLTIADGANGNARFGSDSAYNITGGVDNGGFRFNLPSGVDYQFRINSSEQMRLTSTGLGIGTSSPTQKLEVRTATDKITQFMSGSGTAVQWQTINDAKTANVPLAISTLETYFLTNGTERLRLDSAGNLGLGVTPSAWGSFIPRAIELPNGVGFASQSNASVAHFSANAYYDGSWRYKATGVAARYALGSDTHAWYTAASGTAGNAITFTQAMSLTADGNLLVGTTSFGQPDVNGAAIGAADGAFRSHHATGTASGTIHAYFTYGGLGIGSITQNGTTAVAYNTSSDYRLKNITGSITTSGAYIDSLNPVEGTWKADGSTFVGLIAHEVQEASRTQVATGVKDGAEMQSMDYSNSELIANLIAEVKSLRQRVATLEAK